MGQQKQITKSYNHINGPMSRNYTIMVILTDAEKAFEKTQHPFMIKIVKKCDRRTSHLSSLKVCILHLDSGSCTPMACLLPN